MKIKDAVRISMSIPVYFEAVFMDSKGKVYDRKYDHDNLDVMVDGGILGNFPIFMFDSLTVDSLNNEIRIPNYKTLGVRLDSDLQIKSDSISKELVPIPINNINDYFKAFYIIVHENLNRMPLIPEDWERTISVSSLGISSKIKKLTKKQKDALIQSGKIHTKKYLDKQKQYNDYAKQELTL
jgi:NTE family protein